MTTVKTFAEKQPEKLRLSNPQATRLIKICGITGQLIRLKNKPCLILLTYKEKLLEFQMQKKQGLINSVKKLLKLKRLMSFTENSLVKSQTP